MACRVTCPPGDSEPFFESKTAPYAALMSGKEKRSRRELLKAGLYGAGAVSLGLFSLARCGGSTGQGPAPFGPLRPVADEITGLPLLLLPEGFRYRTVSWAGDLLRDGYLAPAAFDGMGIVEESDGLIRLVRNHELRGSTAPIGAVEKAYDITGGGTTTLLFDKASETIRESWISLGGTLNNCAGGVTPWGTWLSCEEAPFSPELTHMRPPQKQAYWDIERAKKPHGYVFEVPPQGVAEPIPIKAMGQFYHEAAIVDPNSGDVYMTEDSEPKAGLYRYRPRVRNSLAEGGTLQMMAVDGGMDMRSGLPMGLSFPVGWVDIEEPERGFNEGEREGEGVVSQGLDKGGSAFIGLEGAIWDEERLYFTSKLGGAAAAGYVFEYSPPTEMIRLVYESPGHDHFSGPDNLVVSPRANLVVCEDRVTRDTAGQSIAGISRDGLLHKFCTIDPRLEGRWNGVDLAATARGSEWAGVCFSRDGTWMFANIYRPGITVAITGPWDPDWM